jgi:acyl dehydratase
MPWFGCAYRRSVDIAAGKEPAAAFAHEAAAFVQPVRAPAELAARHELDDGMVVVDALVAQDQADRLAEFEASDT